MLILFFDCKSEKRKKERTKENKEKRSIIILTYLRQRQNGFFWGGEKGRIKTGKNQLPKNIFLMKN